MGAWCLLKAFSVEVLTLMMFSVIFCILVLAFYVPSRAFIAHVVIGSLNLATNDMVAADQRWLGNHTGDNANTLTGVSFHQLLRSGWCSVPTASGGLLPLRGLSSSGGLGLLLAEAPDTLFSGEAMATSHLARPGRSATIRHIGIPDVLLLVPLKTFDDLSSGGWSASKRLFRLLPTRTTGSVLQGPGCTFSFFQSCLCKIWDVNCQNYM